MQPSSTLFMRFMLIGVSIVLMTHAFGVDMIRLLIPLYEWMVKQFEFRLSTIEFSIIKHYGEQLLVLETTLFRPTFTGMDTIVPNASIPNAASIPLGNVMLPVIVIFTIVLAWPVQKVRSKVYIFMMRILLALPMCVLVMLVDVPIQMLTLIWESFNQMLNISMNDKLKLFAAWSDFLNGGGLIALSLTSAILIIAFVNCSDRTIEKSLNTPPQSDSFQN